MWPTGFRPAIPGQQLPANRDSTQYRSFTIPGAASGHELFRAVAVHNDYLFVAYNAGIQVWNLANNPGDPVRLDARDGWVGHFLSWPEPGENDSYTQDIAVLEPSGGGNYVVAMAATAPAGLTIWTYNPNTNQLKRIYQHTAMSSFDVGLAEVDGRVYVLAASGGDGVQIYDATTAIAIAGTQGCLDNGSNCTGVREGRVGSPTALKAASYLSLIERGGVPYIAVADGSGLVSNPLTLEIWAVPNPGDPGSATKKYTGPNTRTHGLALFQRGANYYLGNVHFPGFTSDLTLEVRDVTSCLDANGCASPPLSSWGDIALPTHFPFDRHFLSYSESNGDPFLFHGGQGAFTRGPGVEGLYELKSNGDIEEITEGGGTYTDSCSPSNAEIDFWGDYQESNGFGLRNVHGWDGVFNGAYFYRAARGVLDIHVRDDATPNPTVTTAVTSAAPHWFDVPVSFEATANNCPGPETWEWDSSNTDATGLGFDDDTAEITWNLCGSADCPDELVNVFAVKDACATDPNILVNGVNITLQDPRPDIDAIQVSPAGDGTNEFPACTELTFTAAVDGQEPITLDWEVRDALGTLVASETGPSLVWDTGNVQLPPEIFEDGFETGDTTAWGVPEVPRIYDVSVVATNVHDLVGDMDELAVSLTSGEASFEVPGIIATDLGGGQFGFEANTTNATEFRWEIEDPENGSPSGCLYYANCVLIPWSDDAEITHHWSPPNTPGNYGVTLRIRGCSTATPPTQEIIVAVVPDDPDPPVVTHFDVDAADSEACSCALGFCFCDVGTTVEFSVGATNQPDAYLFDWENDGVFEQTVNGSGPFNVPHTFTTTGAKHCRVKAVKGGQESSSFEVQSDLTITNP